MTLKSPLSAPFSSQWVILVLALLVLCGFMFFRIYDDHLEIDKRARDRLAIQARIVDKNLGRQLETANLALVGVLKDMPYWHGPNGRLLANRRLTALCDAMPGVRTMLITDAKGTVIASNRDRIIGGNFGYRAYFAEPKLHPDPVKLYVSPPFKTSLGTFVMSVTRMVPGPRGEFSGVVSASLDPEYFNILLASVLYAPDMWSALAHGDGMQFLMVPERGGQAGKNLHVPGSFFTRHMENGRIENVMTGIVYATGEERIMAMRSISPAALHMDKPIVVAVSRELVAVYADWKREAWTQSVLFCVFTFSSALGLYFFQRRQKAFYLKVEKAEEAIRLKAQYLDSILDSVFLLDLNGNILDVNEAAYTSRGYDKDELIGLPLMRLNYPEFNPLIGKRFAALLESGSAVFESAHIRKDGSVMPVEVHSRLITVEGEKRILGAVRDITERKAAEETLRRSNANLLSIFEAAPFPLTVVRVADRAVTYANPVALKLYDFGSLDQAVGKTVIDLYARPEQRAKVLELLARDGRIDNLELEMRTASGKTIWVVVSARVISYNGEESFLVAQYDITDRKRAEEALKSSESFLHNIIENIPTMLFVKDASELRFVRFNRAGEDLLGYSREELLGKNDYDFFPKSEADFFTEKDREVLAKKLFVDIPEEPILTRAHGPRILHTRKIPIFNKEGHPEYILGISEDITERKLAEEKMLRYARKLDLSNKELEEFAYVASHDLQEPLRKVTSFAGMLADKYKGRLDEKADTLIEFVVDGATRMSNLIRDILTYSRVTTAGGEFGETDCNEVVKRVLGDLELTMKDSQGKITFDILPTVSADALQIGQLFQNLIGNAIKYRGKEAPRVHISAERKVDEWIFSVSDNGIGIDPEHLERIFVIFQRLHTRVEYPGTGIGLAVCKKIVERHGGRIWVESEPGKGSTFFFIIPEKQTEKS